MLTVHGCDLQLGQIEQHGRTLRVITALQNTVEDYSILVALRRTSGTSDTSWCFLLPKDCSLLTQWLDNCSIYSKGRYRARAGSHALQVHQ